MKFLLAYCQPRAHRFNAHAAARERRVHTIEAANLAEAEKARDAFLKQGSLRIDGLVHIRREISLTKASDS